MRLIFFFTLIFSYPALAKKICLNLGESSSQGGVPQGPTGWILDRPCCAPLIDRETIQVCGSAYGGGYAYVCVACGDGKCDKRYENKCNCKEDCK